MASSPNGRRSPTRDELLEQAPLRDNEHGIFAEFGNGSLGLTLDDHMCVVAVATKGAAYQLGIKVGDRLLTVNGLIVANMTREKAVGIVQDARRPLKTVFGRSDKVTMVDKTHEQPPQQQEQPQQQQQQPQQQQQQQPQQQQQLLSSTTTSASTLVEEQQIHHDDNSSVSGTTVSDDQNSIQEQNDRFESSISHPTMTERSKGSFGGSNMLKQFKSQMQKSSEAFRRAGRSISQSKAVAAVGAGGLAGVQPYVRESRLPREGAIVDINHQPLHTAYKSFADQFERQQLRNAHMIALVNELDSAIETRKKNAAQQRTNWNQLAQTVDEALPTLSKNTSTMSILSSTLAAKLSDIEQTFAKLRILTLEIESKQRMDKVRSKMLSSNMSN